MILRYDLIYHEQVRAYSLSIMILFQITRYISFLSFFSSENIALKKSTWQLNPHPGGALRYSANASKAVDGLKTDLSYNGHQCTVSANEKLEAEWRVDLGAVLGIKNITIYYRTDNQLWGIILSASFYS